VAVVAVVQVAGQQLYYEEHGTGTPILGIHGSPSAAAFWEGAAATLSSLGRVLMYDRRGYRQVATSSIARTPSSSTSSRRCSGATEAPAGLPCGRRSVETRQALS
jgi:pimeloyl-ACP methyl ester carboxylesterase